jgi:hypothetical protein
MLENTEEKKEFQFTATSSITPALAVLWDWRWSEVSVYTWRSFWGTSEAAGDGDKTERLQSSGTKKDG